jgi:hypothetical protein
MSVTWDYNGSNQLQAHLSTSVAGHTYDMATGDANGDSTTAVGTGSAMTITQTGIGGNAAGDEFVANVRDRTGKTYLASAVFMYGTASTTGVGYPATWTYDGTNGVSVEFDTSVSDSYALQVEWFDAVGANSFATFGSGPGSPLMLNQTLSTTPRAGSTFVAYVFDETTFNVSTVVSRVFVQGVADSGSPGDTGTGGTETGTAPAGPTGPTGSTGPPATTGYAPTFTVTNLNQDGSEISTFTPIGGTLKWTYRLAQSGGPGDGEWSIALSDDSLTDADQFAPYRTDWKITMHYPGEPDEDLIAGILGPVNLNSEASGVFGQVRVTGKDWLHWLEQPFPFGYADVVADVVTNQLLDPANLFKQWIGQTQETIVGDLITALDGNVGSVVFSASYEGTGWSLTLDKEVAFGDNTSVLDLILDIAKLATVGTDQYGFDMWCDPDKTVHLFAPRVTDPAAVVPVFTLDDANVVAPPLDWTNNGPLETDTVVFGQANNNTSRIGFSDYPASQVVYRQWTQFQQVSLAEEDAIAAAAAGIGQQDRFPQKNLKITIRPDLLDPLDPRVGFRSQLGQGILVHYPVDPYHTIFADFYIVEQAYYTPDGCNWLCDLTLQQIYTADANPDTS